MNPLSLLTKGRTILGLKERPGAYKLLEEGVLPNFSGPKRPVFKTPHPEPENAQTALFEQPLPKVEAPAPVRETPAPAPVPVPAPAPAPVPVKEEPLKPGRWSRLARIAAGWARKWMPWRKAAAQSETVQTELALEKVKVLRNDLSEDDLEVVMIDKEAGKKTEEPARSGKTEREKLTANP